MSEGHASGKSVSLSFLLILEHKLVIWLYCGKIFAFIV